jgi:hypothetical protein
MPEAEFLAYIAACEAVYTSKWRSSSSTEST